MIPIVIAAVTAPIYLTAATTDEDGRARLLEETPAGEYELTFAIGDVPNAIRVVPGFEEGVTVHHDGTALPSMPHIEMTVAMLRQRGVEVDDSDADRWSVAPGAVETPMLRSLLTPEQFPRGTSYRNPVLAEAARFVAERKT